MFISYDDVISENISPNILKSLERHHLICVNSKGVRIEQFAGPKLGLNDACKYWSHSECPVIQI